MHITNQAQAEHFDTGTGEHVYELAGPSNGNMTQHSVAKIEIEPGKGGKQHFHPEVEETYFILSGQGKVTLDGQASILNPGDLVAIPPKVSHYIENPSNTETLTFIATCATPWTPECSVFSEE